nr:MAG TPA: hypothetical protein [Caudoviricetes sp.]
MHLVSLTDLNDYCHRALDKSIKSICTGRQAGTINNLMTTILTSIGMGIFTLMAN